MDPTNTTLVFLLSQPRAGSTMLQRILGGHPGIYTLSEPWLMLHILHPLRYAGPYDRSIFSSSHIALKQFVDELPRGEDDYYEAARRFGEHLYTQALLGTGKRLFLDKTPRYYSIIPDLARTFPNAHYLILFRNPLAVLCSMVSTWVKDNWSALYVRRRDLLNAPDLLVKGCQELEGCVTVVRYEDLVTEPESALRRIYERLGISFFNSVDYGQRELDQWQLGDQTGVYEHTHPTTNSLNKWLDLIQTNPQTWRVAHDYLEALGSETVQGMGYNYDDLLQTLEQCRPSGLLAQLTVSLKWLFNRSPESMAWSDRAVIQLVNRLHGEDRK